MGEALRAASWAALILISMSVILFLPRQFQVAVVENVNEEHLHEAIWLLPLYLLLINIFLLLLLGYAYFRLTGEPYARVAIGLISVAAVAQFAPVILGGILGEGRTASSDHQPATRDH